MASTCIDKNDQTTINRLNLSAGPTTNSNGEYTLNQIDVFAQEFADSIIADARTNPILISQEKYGDSFFDALDYLNQLFLKNRDLSDYPALSDRLGHGKITPLELADFITMFNHTPDGMVSKATRKTNAVLFELERYYAGDIKNGSLGGVCALFETVFAKVDGFFKFVGQVGALIVSAYALLSKIKNPVDFLADLGVQAAVSALIDQIKQLIIEEMNKILEAVAAMLENFNFVRIIGDIKTRIDKATIRTIMQKKDEGCLLLSDENKDTIIRKVEGLFDYAVGLFDNPGIKEMQFLITRFCAFISNVKALLCDFKSPMDQFEFKYKRIANRLNTMSNLTSSTAIRNGAIRFSPEARRERINTIEQSWEGGDGQNYFTPTGEEPINIKEPTIQEYSDLPSCSQVKSGQDSRIKVSGDWVKDFGMEGWTGLDFDLRIYLLRLQARLGVTLDVTSGWVSQQYNARVGGDPDSSHMSGQAVDISRSTISAIVTEEDIAKLALLSGFRFVKVYDKHIHLDTRYLVG